MGIKVSLVFPNKCCQSSLNINVLELKEEDTLLLILIIIHFLFWKYILNNINNFRALKFLFALSRKYMYIFIQVITKIMWYYYAIL